MSKINDKQMRQFADTQFQKARNAHMFLKVGMVPVVGLGLKI